MAFLQNLAGGCCCVANEPSTVIEVNGHSEADGGLFDPVEAASPFLTVKMTRVKGVPIGLDVDMLDGVSLVVDKIKEGFVRTWNEENPAMAIQVCDRIIEVNGTRFNAQALAAELHHATAWELKISRPKAVSVSLEHESKATFGVDLRPSRGALLIAQIGDGFLRDWLAAHPGATVDQYDRIIQVNGTRGKSHKLLRALHATLQESTALTLDILHYDALPAHFESFLGSSAKSKGDEKTVEPKHIILDITGTPEKTRPGKLPCDHGAMHPSFNDAAFHDQEREQLQEI